MKPRSEHRDLEVSTLHAVKCFLFHEKERIPATIVNYHFRGACLKLDETAVTFPVKGNERNLRLDFYVGYKCLKDNVPFRVVWDETRTNGMFGIEFLEEQREFIGRAERITAHGKLKPHLHAMDPLDPNRSLYFTVEDFSATGMMLVTSLTNRHLFPGMVLRNATLSVPGHAPIELELKIQNTKGIDGRSEFMIGCSVEESTRAYEEIIASYLAALVPHSIGHSGLDRIQKAFAKTKLLKKGLTFRICSNDAEYEKTLQLRYLAYGSKGKLGADATWHTQGEGLQREGTIINGYLGGELVCSVEIRSGEKHRPFRFESMTGRAELAGVDLARCLEVNKLVIHPSAQATDTLLGLFQRTHAFALMNGAPPVVLAATDKLKPIYIRLGAREAGVRFPHPSLAGEALNLMIVDPSCYSDGKRLNPLAWQTVYGAITEHMANLGLTHAPERGRMHQMKLTAMKAILPVRSAIRSIRNKRSDARVPLAMSVKSTGAGEAFLKPSWTAQHFATSIIKPYILEAEDLIGSDNVAQILQKLGMPRSYLDQESNWLSTGFLDAFLDEYSRYRDIKELSREAGRRAMRKDALGINYYVLKHLGSPAIALRSIRNFASRFNLTRTYALDWSGAERVRLKLGYPVEAPLPRHRESCDNWQAALEAALAIFDGYNAKIRKVGCCYDGEPSCIYEIQWSRKGRTWRGPLRLAALFGLFGWVVSWQGEALWAEPTLALGGALGLTMLAAFFALVRARSASREADRITTEYERFRAESVERYSELQQSRERQERRYQELKLLEESIKVIQRGDELQDILATALGEACERFSFDRTFVMLRDEQRRALRTAAAIGIDAKLADLWQFKVDLTVQRENPQLLSSVYRSGQSVLIKNVEEHMFQLNAESRRLVRQLGSHSFILAPISGSEGNWGVLIADRLGKKKPLDKFDLVLLERVADHLGVALDKQAKLDAERNLRRVFEKFVPLHVIAGGESQDPALGGQLREISCMFLDIREFTRLSAGMPPQATLDMLNTVFSAVQDVVTSHHGFIDKYLGDGILATWGALPGDALDPGEPVRAAVAILARLAEVNAELSRRGLPTVQVGMGIHRGEAIVGNVGSHERMEFTCIGRTVNLASRLEALCKELQTPIVISQEVFDALGPFEGRHFAMQGGVSVRGLSDVVSVGVYQEGVRPVLQTA